MAQARARDRHHARADPELMLLDEPMAGMGHEDIGRISALIKTVRRRSHRPDGRSTISSVVADLSDRIHVLTRGASWRR